MKKNMLALISRYRTELMGFAGLWILFYHEWRSLFGNSVVGKAERFFAEMGFYGVDFFLFLSGMGLVYAIGKYSRGQFYRRRFGKLLVPYVVTLIICLFVQNWDIPHFLAVFSSWNFWLVDMYTTPWYLYAIMVLYLLFPFYYALFRKMPNKPLFLAGAGLLWLLLSNAAYGFLRFDLYGFTNRIPIFLTGVLVGELAKEGKELPMSGRRWICCGAMLAAGIVCYYLTYYRKLFILVPSSECFLPDYLVTVSGVCLLSQLFFRLEERGRSFGTGILRGMRFLGSISLELYCVQYIFLQRLQILLAGSLPDPLINIVNFGVILLASYGLHRLCAFLNKVLKIG